MKTSNFSTSASVILFAALGYFVDIYDLLLFSIVRVPSLKDLGLDADGVQTVGKALLNLQLAGILFGGIFWGILGDKKGRERVLVGSILTYSLANILNGFVPNIESYYVLRFIAGFGLAGELGAGITLINETLDKEHRGWGAMILATFGPFGAVCAALVSGYFEWRTAFIVGGIMGLLLLFFRLRTIESKLFLNAKTNANKHLFGNFLYIFKTPQLCWKYIKSFLIGVPIWFSFGIVIVFALEYSKALHVVGEVNNAKTILFAYIGMTIGDFTNGSLGQIIKSRKWAIIIFLIGLSLSIGTLIAIPNLNAKAFYFICSSIGFFSGYWATFITMTSEQFGINIRSTVSSTIPNFVRASVIPLSFVFDFFKNSYSISLATAILGGVLILISLFAVVNSKETFQRDLDYFD